MENKKVFLVIDNRIKGFKAVVGIFDNLIGASGYSNESLKILNQPLDVVEMNVSSYNKEGA